MHFITGITIPKLSQDVGCKRGVVFSRIVERSNRDALIATHRWFKSRSREGGGSFN